MSLTEYEKAVAVTLRREWPDLLPTTDAWRPIALRACQVLDGILRSEREAVDAAAFTPLGATE